MQRKKRENVGGIGEISKLNAIDVRGKSRYYMIFTSVMVTKINLVLRKNGTMFLYEWVVFGSEKRQSSLSNTLYFQSSYHLFNKIIIFFFVKGPSLNWGKQMHVTR